MIDIAERKKKLVQDISTQESVIKRLKADLAVAETLLNRLEGAALLCDEFMAEDGRIASPPSPISES